jgi:hypothetical protein
VISTLSSRSDTSLFSVAANQLKLDMFQENNSPELLEQVGLRKKQFFSDEEDHMIKSLQKEHGNKWTLIARLTTETTDTERKADDVRCRWNQLHKYEAQSSETLGHK